MKSSPSFAVRLFTILFAAVPYLLPGPAAAEREGIIGRVRA